MRLRIRNTGTLAWRSDAEQPTHLAYHWQPASRKASFDDFEGWRTDLPSAIEPGTAFEMWGKARAPGQAGVVRAPLGPRPRGGEAGSASAATPPPTWPSRCARAFKPSRASAGPSRPSGEPAPPCPSAPAGAPRESCGASGRSSASARTTSAAATRPSSRRRPPASRTATPAFTRTTGTSRRSPTSGSPGSRPSRGWRSSSPDRSGASLEAGDVAGIGVGLAAALFFVHGALDYFLEFTPLYGLFWLLLGLMSARERARAFPRVPPERHEAADAERDLAERGRPGGAGPAGARDQDAGRAHVEHQHEQREPRHDAPEVARDDEVGEPEVQVDQRNPEGEHPQRRRGVAELRGRRRGAPAARRRRRRRSPRRRPAPRGARRAGARCGRCAAGLEVGARESRGKATERRTDGSIIEPSKNRYAALYAPELRRLRRANGRRACRP